MSILLQLAESEASEKEVGYSQRGPRLYHLSNNEWSAEAVIPGEKRLFNDYRGRATTTETGTITSACAILNAGKQAGGG